MLKVYIKRAGNGIYVIGPIGRIIGKKEDDKVNKAINKCERNKKCKHIILDLSDVDFMDSAFVGAIGYHYAMMSHDGGDLFVVNQNTSPFNYVHRIIEFFSVDKVVRVYPTMEECVNTVHESDRKKAIMDEAEKIRQEEIDEEVEAEIEKNLDRDTKKLNIK